MPRPSLERAEDSEGNSKEEVEFSLFSLYTQYTTTKWIEHKGINSQATFLVSCPHARGGYLRKKMRNSFRNSVVMYRICFMKRVPLLLSVFLLVSCAVKPPQKQAGPITLFLSRRGRASFWEKRGRSSRVRELRRGEVAYGTLDGKPLKGYLAVPPGEVRSGACPHP